MEDNITTYNTWHQFVKAADSMTDLNPRAGSSRDIDHGDWFGTNNFEETIHLATHGWPDGLRRIKTQVHIIERFISSKQPRKELAYAVRGPGILDLERYQQGRPDSWLTWELKDQQVGQSAKIVPIVYNLSASGGVSIETMFNRGAAVCALVDILEHSNIRVELILAEYASYNNRHGSPNTFLWKVMLKHSEDVLDMDRLAFALCNASVLRRLMFSLSEQYVPNLPSNYGSPRTYQEDGAINIDAASMYIRKEEDMVPWLIKQLAGYGVEIQE